jgi:hypothetical protein
VTESKKRTPKKKKEKD